MTPIGYLGHRLPPLDPQARRVRARMITGELLTNAPAEHRGHQHRGFCDHGAAFTARERDFITEQVWKTGRPQMGRDGLLRIYGGPQDGAEVAP